VVAAILMIQNVSANSGTLLNPDPSPARRAAKRAFPSNARNSTGAPQRGCRLYGAPALWISKANATWPSGLGQVVDSQPAGHVAPTCQPLRYRHYLLVTANLRNGLSALAPTFTDAFNKPPSVGES
jgi:hypothetical protein